MGSETTALAEATSLSKAWQHAWQQPDIFKSLLNSSAAVVLQTNTTNDDDEFHQNTTSMAMLLEFGLGLLCLTIGCMIFVILRKEVCGFEWWHNRRPPKFLSWCGCQWISDVWRVPEEQVVALAGVDALMFLRFQLLLAKLCGFWGFIGCFFLVPIYATAPLAYHHQNVSLLTGTDFFTLSNVPSFDQGNSHNYRLWITTFASWIFFGIAVWLLEAEYAVYVRLLHSFLRRPRAHNYTVLVRELPLHLRSNQSVSAYFRHLYPDAFYSAHMIPYLPELDALIEDRKNVALQLEEAVEEWHRTKKVVMWRVEKEVAVAGGAAVEAGGAAVEAVEEGKLEKVQTILGCFRCRCGIGRRSCCAATKHKPKIFCLELLLERLNREVSRMHCEVGAHDGEAHPGDLAQGEGIGNALLGFMKKGIETGISDVETVGNRVEKKMGEIKGDTIKALTAGLGTTGGARELEEEGGQEERGGRGEEMVAESVQMAGEEQARATRATRVARAGAGGAGAGAGAGAGGGVERSALKNALGEGTTSKIEGASSKIGNTLVDGTAKMVGEGSKIVGGVVGGVVGVGVGAGLVGASLLLGTNANSTAFVTFKNLVDASKAVQVRHSPHSALEIVVTPAPPAEDILWHNLGMPQERVLTRSCLIWTATAWIWIFWAIPSAFFSSISNLESFESDFGLQGTTATSVAEAVSPLILILMLDVVPPLFDLLSNLEGVESNGQLQIRSFNKYVPFLIFQVFFVSCFSLTIEESIKAIVAKPAMVFQILGQAVPSTSSFFIQYIIIRACVSSLSELLRLPRVAEGWVRRLWSGKTWSSRARALPNSCGCLNFACARELSLTYVWGLTLLIWVITSIFALIAPMLVIATLLEMLIEHTIYKYQILYVYKQVQRRPVMWPYVFDACFWGLYLGQLTLIGVMILKQAWECMIFLFLPLLLLAWVQHRYNHSTLLSPVLPPCALTHPSLSSHSPLPFHLSSLTPSPPLSLPPPPLSPQVQHQVPSALSEPAPGRLHGPPLRHPPPAGALAGRAWWLRRLRRAGAVEERGSEVQRLRIDSGPSAE
jgi:hypothetical protein